MERSELKALVPAGYQKMIAQRAGVEQSSVSCFLNGKSNNVKIELAALEIVAELQDKRKQLIERIKA